MKHTYTSHDGTSGVWKEDEQPHAFCDWWWDSDALRLYVRQGNRTRRWMPDSTKPSVLDCVFQKLPDIAVGIARQLAGCSDP